MNPNPTLSQASKVWAKIGLLSFGGPAAQIAMMNTEVVSKRAWLTDRQFLNALNFCMLLPGPEAMQLATYTGWRLNGTLGGLIAGLFFVLPGAFVIMLLATFYVYYGSVPLVDALFLGIKATVVVIVIEALLRVAKKTLRHRVSYAIATASFVGIFFLNLPYPFIVLAAGILGWLFVTDASTKPEPRPKIPFRKTIQTVVLWLAIWWAPVALVYLMSGPSILIEISTFFSKLAIVTFGGAYAVLAYMAQDVVGMKGWLDAGQMMDGLGLAETTPGPLILVTEFVGFLAGFKNGGLSLAITAALLTLWVTFAPCFMWIFAGAPYIDWIGTHPHFKNALSAITAAVVGVILNLSIWFAIHVFFESVTDQRLGILKFLRPDLASINWLVVALAILAGYLLLKRHMNVIFVLFITAIISAVCAQIGII